MSKESKEKKRERWEGEWKSTLKKDLSLLTPLGNIAPYFKLVRENFYSITLSFFTHTYQYGILALYDVPESIKKNKACYCISYLDAYPRKPIAGQEYTKRSRTELLLPEGTWIPEGAISKAGKWDWKHVEVAVFHFELVKTLREKGSIFSQD